MENLFISIDNFIPKPIGFTVYRLELRMGFKVVHNRVETVTRYQRGERRRISVDICL